MQHRYIPIATQKKFWQHLRNEFQVSVFPKILLESVSNLVSDKFLAVCFRLNGLLELNKHCLQQ
jgi:hypothetical protein